MTTLLHQSKLWLSGFLLVLMGCLVATPAYSQDLDLQPPVMELQEIQQGIAGETQVFTATVTDEKALTSVILYHRLVGDERYASTEMLPLPGTDIFTASVATTSEDPRDIEYYLQAEDTGGNKAIKGFAFDPLVRDMTGDVVATAATTSAPTAGMSRNRKIMWTALGVLAIGLLASQSGGGSSGGGDSTPSSPPIDIDVNPVNQ